MCVIKLTKLIEFVTTRFVYFLAHSKNGLIQWRGVRRLSVCLSVCSSENLFANRFFSETNGPIATKLAHDGRTLAVDFRQNA